MPFAIGDQTGNIVTERVIDRTTGQVEKVNEANTWYSALAQCHFKSRTQSSAPGSPAEGDLHIVASGATGFGSASTNDVAVYTNAAWASQTPSEGWRGWVDDEDIPVRFDGSAWVEVFELAGIASGLTASTTQTQGQGALTKGFNQVSTCANANDVRTLPAAIAGKVVVVVNDGAQTLQVFPASGDKIDNGSTNASVTIAAGKRRTFYAYDSTNWSSSLGA